MTRIRLFRGKSDDLKGIRARSAVVRSAEIPRLSEFPRAITREEARAALERSRARRAMNGD
ncbi:MAG TPA: hypothetical protein VH418_05720 [Solirubrobacteraceae bacterium]|jgi:hypothetical protein